MELPLGLRQRGFLAPQPPEEPLRLVANGTSEIAAGPLPPQPARPGGVADEVLVETVGFDVLKQTLSLLEPHPGASKARHSGR